MKLQYSYFLISYPEQIKLKFFARDFIKYCNTEITRRTCNIVKNYKQYQMYLVLIQNNLWSYLPPSFRDITDVYLT